MFSLAVYNRYVNDYVDVNSITNFKQKGFAPDLDEGNKSFLMILADMPITKRTRSDCEKRGIILKFTSNKVYDKALELINKEFDYIFKLLCEIEVRLGPNDSIKTLLKVTEFNEIDHPPYHKTLFPFALF